MVLAVAGDVAALGVGTRVIELGLEAFGRVDTLINNATAALGSDTDLAVETAFTARLRAARAGRPRF